MTAGPEQDTPQRPDVTKAQRVAAVIAGVPIVCNLLAAFGIFAPSLAQQHALTETMTWAAVAAGLLVASDAHLRGKRNDAVAAVAVAEAAAAAPSPPVENTHSDPGPAFGHLGARVTYDADTRMSDFEPEPVSMPAPDLREAGEVDLDDPALDDPAADEAGVARSALAEHYAHACDPNDVLERDDRLQGATGSGVQA